MWIPRLASLVLLVASAATGYTLAMLMVNDSLATNLWVACAFIGIMLSTFGVVGGLGGILLSFIVEPDGKGRFRYRQNELADFLYPRWERTRGESYCRASMHTSLRMVQALMIIVFIGIFGYLGYQFLMEHLTEAAYVAGGLLALIVIIVLCVVSKAFRTVLFCFLGGSAVLGTAWFVHSLDWASAGKWTVETSTSALPWVIGIAGVVALIFVIRFFLQSKTYRAMCPINSDR